MPWPLLCDSRQCTICWCVFKLQLQRRYFGFNCFVPLLRKLRQHMQWDGCPPFLPAAALVDTNCNSLTVWPLRWLAWRAEKAGALPTVWYHFVEFYCLSASHFNFVSMHGYVVSTPLPGRNMQAIRVVSAPGLQWLPVYLELSLCLIIEPTRSQVRAAQRHPDHVSTARRAALEVRVPVFSRDGGIQASRLQTCFIYWWRSCDTAVRKVLPGGAV